MESNGWVMWNMGTFNDPCPKTTWRTRGTPILGNLHIFFGELFSMIMYTHEL